MNPADPNFIEDAIGKLLSNASGLLIGVLMVIVIIVAISISGGVSGKNNQRGEHRPDL